MASLQLTVLGGFAAIHLDRSVEVSGKKNQALLAYLALHPGKKLTRAKLADLFWGDRHEAQARSSLRQSLAVLRRDLAGIEPPPLAVDSDTVTLDGSAVSTDVAALEQLATSDSTEELRQAAQLYQGDLLDGLAVHDPAFEEWLRLERGRLREVAVEAMMRLMIRLSGTEAIAMGQRLVALDPLREASHHALIQIYAAQGQFDQAIRQHHSYQDVLRRELNLAPSARFETLYREIRDGKYQGRLATLSTQGEPSVAVRSVESGSDDAALPTFMLLGKPSIAVLPFANMSGDPGQEYFAHGLTEDIISALARVSGLTVAARTSSFSYLGQQVSAARIAKELGVRYVMEGSVRRAGDQVRVTVQLIDGITGHHVWAERYDRLSGDIFQIQDEIMRSVAASTETQIQLSELQRIESRMAAEPRAGDLVTQAWARMYDFPLDALAEAAELAKKAIRLEPMNSRAHIILARIHVYRLWFHVIAHDNENVAAGIRLAELGIRLAPRDEWAHLCMAGALEMAGRTEEAWLNASGLSSSIRILRLDMPSSAETSPPMVSGRKPSRPA
jgi:TolB-like protein/two-component SAPR family response regulator